MTVLDRLDVLIRELEQELRLLDDKIANWNRLPCTNEQQCQARDRAVATWTQHKTAPADVLAMLQELRAKCVAQGMKNSEPCICPEHATDEACPACVAGYIP